MNASSVSGRGAAALFAPQRVADIAPVRAMGPAEAGATSPMSRKGHVPGVAEPAPDNGLREWAEQNKLEKLRAKFEGEVLSERGADPMAAAGALRSEIADIVDQRVRQSLEQDAQRKAQTGAAPMGIVLDLKA